MARPVAWCLVVTEKAKIGKVRRRDGVRDGVRFSSDLEARKVQDPMLR